MSFASDVFGESFDTTVDERDVNTLPFQIERGRKLRPHVAFQNLLRDIDRLGGRAVSLDDMSQVVARRLRDSDKAPPEFPRRRLSSLLALVAPASGDTTKSTREPLLSVRVELWLRELRRMVATLAAQPALVYSDDVGISDTRLMYAPVHCRDCHVMGCGATQTATDDMIASGFAHVLRGVLQRRHCHAVCLPRRRRRAARREDV